MVQFDVEAALRRHLVRRLTDELAATNSNCTTTSTACGLTAEALAGMVLRMRKPGKGEMTVSEMGRLGGLARAAKCTPEQLSAIGRYGYEHGLAKYSPEERREMLRSHGRPRARLSKKKIALMRKLFKAGMPQARIAETLGVGRPTIARHLQRGKWRKPVQKPHG